MVLRTVQICELTLFNVQWAYTGDFVCKSLWISSHSHSKFLTKPVTQFHCTKILLLYASVYSSLPLCLVQTDSTLLHIHTSCNQYLFIHALIPVCGGSIHCWAGKFKFNWIIFICSTGIILHTVSNIRTFIDVSSCCRVSARCNTCLAHA